MWTSISQRDYTQYYDHISKQKEDICRGIQDFFKKHIQYKFLDEDFVFDIYRDSRGKVWLIDFNPFGEVTDSLLFTWEELTSENNLNGDFSEVDAQGQDSPAFRCTNSEVTVQPSPYLSYRLPKDFVDLSTGEDAHKLIDFLKLVKSIREISKRMTDECAGAGEEEPLPLRELLISHNFLLTLLWGGAASVDMS
ncbi:Cell division cycle protein 123-like protein [Plecturocebus cupreus]